jgi:hemerythrin
MPIVEWNISFLLGIQEIDQHHKHLVELLNKTYDEYKEGAPAENLRSVIDELLDYSTYHFECEERWMTETLYPNFIDHKAEHVIFTKRISELQKNFQFNTNISLEVLSFLSNWITHHILKTDAKYGHFVADQNIRKRINRNLIKRPSNSEQ